MIYMIGVEDPPENPQGAESGNQGGGVFESNPGNSRGFEETGRDFPAFSGGGLPGPLAVYTPYAENTPPGPVHTREKRA